MKNTKFFVETFDTGTRLVWNHQSGSVTQIDIVQGHAIFQFIEKTGKKHHIQLTPEMMANLKTYLQEYKA